MKTVYTGIRRSNGSYGCVVTTSTNYGTFTEPLPQRQDVQNHSPDGFAWGYAGSGPAQLALALALHVLNDVPKALRLYQAFKDDVIAKLDQNTGWEMTEQTIRDHLTALERAQ